MDKFNVSACALETTFTATNRNERSPVMSSLKKLTRISAITTVLCLVVFALPSAAVAYNVATDFSGSSNPNGVWSYGWSTSLGENLILDTYETNSLYGGLTAWLGMPGPGGNPYASPYVAYNGTATSIVISVNNVYQPGQLAMVPGFTNDYAVTRFTAPSGGTFGIAATFSGLSRLGDAVYVYVLHNGSPIFSSSVFGSPSPTSYSVTTNLAAGDTIDFVVATGTPSGNNYETTTLLNATITPATPPCPNLVGTWTGQMNVVDAWRGYSTTPLSMQVTDQSTNGCLIRGFLTMGNASKSYSNIRFVCNPWFRLPFTGTIPDASTVLLNVGGDGSGKASAILDLSQTPPVLTKFVYQPNNGDTLTGDLTLRPSSP